MDKMNKQIEYLGGICQKIEVLAEVLKEDDDEFLINELNDIASELDKATAGIENLVQSSIFDINNFKLQLERMRLMTTELEEFIESYMRFDNN